MTHPHDLSVSQHLRSTAQGSVVGLFASGCLFFYCHRIELKLVLVAGVCGVLKDWMKQLFTLSPWKNSLRCAFCAGVETVCPWF